MVVTSCNRHDLLQRMQESFYRVTDIEPQQVIIVEDGDTPRPAWLSGDIWKSRNVLWLNNNCRMGQIYSIDRAYSRVETEYIFHCEDDWEFQLRDNWMCESKAILDANPKIIQVSLRNDTEWQQLLINEPAYPFKIVMPYWYGCWGGISFNPGLRRTSDYRRLGSYGRHVGYGTSGFGHEEQLSKKLLDEGWRIADLNRPIVVHTGGNRSRAVEALPPMPKLLIAIPACHKFEYGRCESEYSPDYAANKPWNRASLEPKIHVLRKNDRVNAIRDTWAKDIEPFKNRVTLRFVYGEPHNRAALPDEIFLEGIPDDYESLPLKTVAIAKHTVENGYDFVFKCYDNTAVYMDRLVRELIENRFDYAGWCNAKACMAGPGYFLSKRACKILATQGSNPGRGTEDVWISKIMDHNNVKSLMLGGHKPRFASNCFVGDKLDPSKLSADIVTMHAVQPDEMRLWHEYVWSKK